MFARDKKLHFWAGLALAIVAGLFLYPVIVWLPWAWLKWMVAMGVSGFGLFVATLGGAVKELIWDLLLKKGTPEWLDFWCTVLGGCLGYILLRLMGG